MHHAFRFIPLVVSLAVCNLAVADDAQLAAGRALYEQGKISDGNSLNAVGAGGSRLSGTQAACVQCHRRSGYGGREGDRVISPITGEILFSKPHVVRPVRPGRIAPEVIPLREYTREAYDDEKLLRAIRTGIDASGRPLDELMPRYELPDRDGAALVAYLRQLSVAPPVGLAGGRLHLATVIAPDADPVRAKVVEETLLAWSKAGPLGGIPLDLHVWRLEGAPSNWTRQLQALYDREPVYAVLSGAGHTDWQPVHAFCQSRALPCLFPIVDLAPGDSDDFYPVYFSTGVTMEARLLARHIGDLPSRPARVVQWVADGVGEAAAKALSTALGPVPVLVRHWSSGSERTLDAELQPGDLLVSWLNTDQLAQAARALPDGPKAGKVILSGQLAAPQRGDLPLSWRMRARWISVRSEPARVHGQGVLGLVPWAAHMNLSFADESLASEVYAATYFFGDALARMRGRWNRELLVETLESAAFSRPAGSAFFGLSLAKGQREAAKAGYLLGFQGPGYRDVVRFGERISEK